MGSKPLHSISISLPNPARTVLPPHPPMTRPGTMSIHPRWKKLAQLQRRPLPPPWRTKSVQRPIVSHWSLKMVTGENEISLLISTTSVPLGNTEQEEQRQQLQEIQQLVQEEKIFVRYLPPNRPIILSLGEEIPPTFPPLRPSRHLLPPPLSPPGKSAWRSLNRSCRCANSISWPIDGTGP